MRASSQRQRAGTRRVLLHRGLLGHPRPLQGVFDVKEHLTAWWLKAGYFILTVLFASFTLVYAWAALGVMR